jgi:hypothetical protein
LGHFLDSGSKKGENGLSITEGRKKKRPKNNLPHFVCQLHLKQQKREGEEGNVAGTAMGKRDIPDPNKGFGCVILGEWSNSMGEGNGCPNPSASFLYIFKNYI